MKTIPLGMVIILLIIAFVGGVFAGTRLPIRNFPFMASLINTGKEIEEIATGTKASALQKELPLAGDLAKVVQVLDGDTILIEGGEQVRYIGIDAPEESVTGERVCFAKEATEINKIILEGKSARLIKDTNDRDPLNRLLRYVYAEDENGKGVMVNEKLVREGAARATPYPPDTKFDERFKKAEEEANAAKRGLWESCFTRS